MGDRWFWLGDHGSCPALSNMIRFFTASILLLCLVVGCANYNDEHNFGIGQQYTFERFTLEDSTGAKFSLTDEELASLELAWNNSTVVDAINVSNTLQGLGVKLKYEYTLNDGFESAFTALYGSVNNQAYLRIDVVGNGGGFPADVYTNLVPIDTILAPKRLKEFDAWVEPK